MFKDPPEDPPAWFEGLTRAVARLAPDDRRALCEAIGAAMSELERRLEEELRERDYRDASKVINQLKELSRARGAWCRR